MLAVADAAPVRRRRAARHPVALGVLCLLAAGLYAATGCHQVATLHAGTYDLALFDQAVRSYSQFHLGVSPVDGVHRGFGLGFSVLGDHFSPILALLAPLYWLHSGPVTLIVAQAVLVAAAIPPLWVFTRRELGGVWPAYGVVVAYAVSWPVAAAVSFDFHEAAFAPPLMALLFERFSALRAGHARCWQVVLPAVGLLLVKEDMGLFVAGFGLAMVLRSARPLGAGFVVGGLTTVALVTGVVLPAFGSNPIYYWRYGTFGPSAPSAALDMLTHPALVVHTALSPEVKVHTLLAVFGLAAFACLFSPYLLAIAPLLAERMLADAPSWWGTAFHYNLFVVVPVLCGGVDAIARLGSRLRGRSASRLLRPVWTVVVLAVAAWNLPAFGPVLDAASWQPIAQTRAADAAVARVPSGVVVETPNNLGPLLTGRDTVLLWDRLPRWASWVVADVARATFPFCSLAEQRNRVGYLLAHGYQEVFADDGYLVLRAARRRHRSTPPVRRAARPDPATVRAEQHRATPAQPVLVASAARWVRGSRRPRCSRRVVPAYAAG
jgi:uncharacterized membrane protein